MNPMQPIVDVIRAWNRALDLTYADLARDVGRSIGTVGVPMTIESWLKRR